MLERYFVKPATVDRIRGSWIAAEIENTWPGWSTRATAPRVSGVASRWCSPLASSLVGAGRALWGLAGACRRVRRRSASRATMHALGRTGRWRRRYGARSSSCSRSFSMLQAHRPGAPGQPVRRCRPRFLRLPARGAWSASGLAAGLSPPPRSLRGLPPADRCGVDPGAVTGDPGRLRRRARCCGAGQDHGARRCRCPAGVPAVRLAGRHHRHRPGCHRRVPPGLPAFEHPSVYLLGRCQPGPGRCRAPDRSGQARLRHLAAAGHLWAAWPGGRRAHP